MAYQYYSQPGQPGQYYEDSSEPQPVSYAPDTYHTQRNDMPSTTPTRKRRNKPNAGRNGYHSDTATAHYGRSNGQHAASQSIDLASQGYAVPGNTALQAPNPSITPPRHVASTPTKAQVYAGPTFLASPAASSLPMPKAFSKSTPTPPMKSPQAPGDHTGESVRGNRGSPAPASSLSLGRGGSPLDMLFHADRAEKSRKALDGASPLSQMQSVSHDHQGAGRRLTPQSSRRPVSQGNPSKARMIQEADGNSDHSETEDDVEERVTFKQRMQAIAEDSPQSSRTDRPVEDELAQRQRKTRALKSLLLDSDKAMAPGAANDAYAQQPGSFGAFSPPSSGPRTFSGPPSQPSHGYHNATNSRPRPASASAEPADLKAMEDNLRRMLKLGP